MLLRRMDTTELTISSPQTLGTLYVSLIMYLWSCMNSGAEIWKYVPWKHPYGERLKSWVLCIIDMTTAMSKIPVPQIHRDSRAFPKSGSEGWESQRLGMMNRQPKPESAETINHSFLLPGWLQPVIAHLQKKPLAISKASSPHFSSIR